MQMHKIVVGTDFSEQAELAVNEAVNIARRQGAELVLVHVGTVPQPVGEGLAPAMKEPAERFANLLKQQYDENRSKLTQLRERLDGQSVRVSQAMIDAFPDEGLAKASKQLGADLLVVGTHGRTGFRRFQLGSVAERVVRLADCSVMVARPEPKGVGGYRKILVPIDFSDYTKPALETAIAMACDGAQIELFHVWQLPGATALTQDVWAAHGGRLREELAAAAVRNGEELVADARSPQRVDITFTHAENRPAAGIRERLDEDGFDLVVMGSHGRRGFRRWMLGSVAETTVRYAPCSVVIVHRDEE